MLQDELDVLIFLKTLDDPLYIGVISSLVSLWSLSIFGGLFVRVDESRLAIEAENEVL